MSSFTDKTPTFNSNDIKLNLNQRTIDLLNAAIASHSHTQLQQVQQQLLLSNGVQPQQTEEDNNSISPPPPSQPQQQQQRQQQQQQHQEQQTGTSKRSIDSTDESDVTVTATPKRPGRKPLEKTTASDVALDPKQKRKAQNRAAQRAFRERKEKHVSELQQRIKELEELTSKTDEDLINENARLKEQLKKLEEENYALKDAKFTFEFPINDPEQQKLTNTKSNSYHHSNTTTPSTTEAPTTHPSSSPTSSSSPSSSSSSSSSHKDEYGGGGSSSSSSEQSPLSLGQEDDSDTPATKTPTSFQGSSAFMPFGSMTNPKDFDFLAIPGNDSLTTPSSTLDFKELFHGKDDLFTGYRAPPATTSDDINADEFLLDNGLPALFGGDDLFGFSSQPQQHTPFLLDQFYMPTDVEPQPHVRKETLETSLQRAKHQGVRAYEVQQQLKNCSDFNLDALCEDLKAKASCCDSQYLLTERDVESYLRCFDQK